MAQENRCGEFSLKIASLTFTPGPANSVLVQANCEGPVTGFRDDLGTVRSWCGKSGTFSWCAVTYLDNGDILTYQRPGDTESRGSISGAPNGVVQLSDGRSIGVEGEIDLAARTWNGKFFERS